MAVTIVLGSQWGDEGKGKIVDYLAQKADLVARFNGGPNAGHTVINKLGKFKLHQVPAGIFNRKTVCLIGNGSVVDPKILIEEIEGLKKAGVSCRNLKISPRAHLIMPWHILLDGRQEECRGAKNIGTTRRGIGPAFADKTGRFGLRAGDLLDEMDFCKKILFIHMERHKLLKEVYNCWELREEEYIRRDYLAYREYLMPFIDDVEYIIQKALKDDKNILLEGAQGFGLDIDFGTYPDVTSSQCTAAGACQGSGIPPTKIKEVVGVIKAFPTRVGSKEQPFPTEMEEAIANPLRERAGEYGATTGRPRRIGWFDALQIKYAVLINGFTGLAITRLDSLAGIEKLKLCYGYRTSDGGIISPLLMRGLCLTDLKKIEPVYIELDGWKEFPQKCKKFSDLPREVKLYIHTIEGEVGVPIKYVSTGPERSQIIVR